MGNLLLKVRPDEGVETDAKPVLSPDSGVEAAEVEEDVDEVDEEEADEGEGDGEEAAGEEVILTVSLLVTDLPYTSDQVRDRKGLAVWHREKYQRD